MVAHSFFTVRMYTGHEDASSKRTTSSLAAVAAEVTWEEERKTASSSTSLFLANSVYAIRDKEKERKFFHDFKYSITKPDLRKVST